MSVLQVPPSDVSDAYERQANTFIQEALKRAAEWEASAKVAAQRIDELEKEAADLRKLGPDLSGIAVGAVAEKFGIQRTTVEKYVKTYFEVLGV